MRVRRLAPTDVDTLRAIRLEALRTDPDAFGSTLEREEGRSDDDWRAWLSRGATFVADGPVGLVVALPQDDRRTIALLSMFVAGRARRRGVGRALVEEAVEWAESTGAERVALMVIERNPSARALYESCGFAYTGEQHSRERDGAIELVMTRVIRTER